LNKEVTDWELFQRFLVYARPHWKSLALGVATVPFSVGTTLLLPWLIIRIIDDHVIPGDLDGLYQMATFMALAVAVGYFSDSISLRTSFRCRVHSLISGRLEWF
jgi:ATP-binding cassette subfamily B multidrug efflux pump